MGNKSPSLNPRSRILAFWMVLAILFARPAASGASAEQPTQYDVEAAYLAQFPKFVQWPSKKKRTEPKALSICVLGRDPFGRVLDVDVAGEKVNGVPLVAKRLGSAREAAGCQVLFVSSSEQYDLAGDLAALRGSPVLTVSDIPGFASRGGMIQFVLIGDQVRFRVNLGNTKRAGITVSSQLLKVAVTVQRGPT